MYIGKQQLHKSDNSVCTTAPTEIVDIGEVMTSGVHAYRKTESLMIQIRDSMRKRDSPINCLEEATRDSEMEGDLENQSTIQANEPATNTLQAMSINMLQTAEKVSVFWTMVFMFVHVHICTCIYVYNTKFDSTYLLVQCSFWASGSDPTGCGQRANLPSLCASVSVALQSLSRCC